MINFENELEKIISEIQSLDLSQKVEALNYVRSELHKISPFKNEPIDLVTWELNSKIFANNYNPNSVASPELKLLELSISSNGFTQPIVTMHIEEGREVIDGFHRTKVSKESEEIKERLFSYAPVVTIKGERTDLSDRMAATIQHNRARGKHKISAMSDIVLDLRKRNWSDSKIAKNLGMDQDEILRLCQIGGIQEQFSDQEFSEAWEAELYNDENID